MKRKAIAIVGSIDPNRQPPYQPPLQNIEEAKKVAELLGTTLGKRGYRIIVYSAEPGFIECHVVRGFIKASKLEEKSIVVHYPTNQFGPEGFPEYTDHKEKFKPHQYSSDSWENAFYRSLSEADGLVLLGGGYSTLITGLVALTYRVPLVTLFRYGGSARPVWTAIERGQDLPTEEDVQNMARQGTPEMVQAWVKSLETQFVAKEKERNQTRSAWPAIVTMLLLLALVIVATLGYLLRPPQTKPDSPIPLLFAVLLFLGPMLSGAAGARVESLWSEGGQTSLKTTVLGTAAGIFSGYVYLVAQLVANPPNFFVFIFTLLFGFTAGFTLDKVFKKLAATDALPTPILPKPGQEKNN